MENAYYYDSKSEYESEYTILLVTDIIKQFTIVLSLCIVFPSRVKTIFSRLILIDNSIDNTLEKKCEKSTLAV